MTPKEIYIIFEKYLEGKASQEEINFIEKFEEFSENKIKGNVFRSKMEKDNIKEAIFRKIQETKQKRTFDRNWLKIAASVIILVSFGLGYFYEGKDFPNKTNLNIPNENITLQTEDGNIKTLNEDGSIEIVDINGNVVGTQNGNQLIYSNKVVKETLTYNTLKIPYGKRFEVKLSDGTVVNLNAGSSLKYPTKFIKGEKRKVYLKGEAYFNVTKDINHPFIVTANEIDVRVLGTQFNISSYPEDKHISTVLVEGSVSLYDKGNQYDKKTATLLEPGFKGTWDKTRNSIDVEKTDVAIHTAWIKGKIIFRQVKFNTILTKLERHYNVKIINNNKELGERYFVASFDIETIEEVLKSFSENHEISYSIENNKIIIN